MIKKYRMTDATMIHNGYILHRIEALRDFGNVHAGELGGWIESEDNLSHYGNCWISGEAKAYECAEVKDNAHMYCFAEVYGNAEVRDDAMVSNNAKVYGLASVEGKSYICNNARIYGDAEISGLAFICGNAEVYGNAKVRGEAEIGDDAKVYGNVDVFRYARIMDEAIVAHIGDYITFHTWWSDMNTITWTKSNDMWCDEDFCGTANDLLQVRHHQADNYKSLIKYVGEVVKPQLNR